MTPTEYMCMRISHLISSVILYESRFALFCHATAVVNLYYAVRLLQDPTQLSHALDLWDALNVFVLVRWQLASKF